MNYLLFNNIFKVKIDIYTTYNYLSENQTKI
jgi:hypothetical protein